MAQGHRQHTDIGEKVNMKFGGFLAKEIYKVSGRGLIRGPCDGRNLRLNRFEQFLSTNSEDCKK